MKFYISDDLFFCIYLVTKERNFTWLFFLFFF